MQRLFRLGLALLASLFLLVPSAQAEDSESIGLFDIYLAIQPTGEVVVTERIVYNFGSSERHGIYRTIPLADNLPDGSKRLYEVELRGVALNGAAVEFEESADSNFYTVKIGDPNATITGTQIYEIQYVLSGALHPFTETEALKADMQAGDLELYWDVIGDGWQVPIDSVFVNLQTPGIPTQAACYPVTGTVCNYVNGVFEAVELAAGEPLTISIWLAAENFSVEVTENIQAPWSKDFARGLPFGILFALLVSGGLIFLIVRQRNSVKLHAIHNFVRFEIPDNLKPAEISVAVNGKFGARDLTATLLHLATLGYVAIDADKSSLKVRKLRDWAGLASWEQELLKTIFRDADTASLSDYDRKLEKTVNRTEAVLLKAAAISGRRPANLNQKKSLFIVLSVVFAILILPSLVGLKFPFVAGVIWPAVIAGSLISLLGIALVPKQHTAQSAEFLSAVNGFKKSLDTAAAEDRRAYAQSKNLDSGAIFATFLPFAVIFGLEKAWLAAHPQLTAAALGTYGIYVSDLGNFDNQISSFTAGITSAMTSPSSTDGGSAGGGGGGGGGGSW